LGDDDIPDVELTTASELDGRPFEDEEQEEYENTLADENDQNLQGMPRRRNYKV
jgi:hypothetical protein